MINSILFIYLNNRLKNLFENDRLEKESFVLCQKSLYNGVSLEVYTPFVSPPITHSASLSSLNSNVLSVG